MKAGWTIKTLDQIAINLDHKRVPITKSDRIAGQFPYYGASGIVDYVADYIFEGDALLVSEDGANLLARSSPIAFPATGRYWVNNHAHILRFDEPTTQRYVELYLESIPLDEYITGAAQPKLNQKALNSIPIPVAPLDEQRRIVAILDEAFEAIATAKANAEKNLRNAREVFESRRDEVLSGSGTNWREAPLSELCFVKHGYAFEGEFFSPTGDYVLLTPGNYFESGGYRDRGEKQKYFVGPIPKDYVLKEGALLVAMTEQAAGLLGSPLLVPESDRFLHNQRLGLVVGQPEVPWLNDFFFHVFNLRRVRDEIHASASGVKVRHTSPSKIGAVCVAYPNSIDEQRRIASQLRELSTECDELAAIYARKLAALDELKKSLLHRAFTGQL